MAAILPDAQLLESLFQKNRQRHGKAWYRIRLERIPKLLPDRTEDEIFDAVWSAVNNGLLEWNDQFENDEDVPYLKLVKFVYTQKGRYS